MSVSVMSVSVVAITVVPISVVSIPVGRRLSGPCKSFVRPTRVSRPVRNLKREGFQVNAIRKEVHIVIPAAAVNCKFFANTKDDIAALQ